MTTISARTILRSRNAASPDKVLSTLLLRYPRWIHAELLTHRVLSRNSASSRAIPVEKLIRDVEENPAYPLVWGSNKPGMQAGVQVDPVERVVAYYTWESALNDAIRRAKALSSLGLHKQIVNRLLEPFAHITVLVSATEWDNFLELRDHEDAEPHIQMLAKEVRKCLEDESTVQTLKPGQWHLPFVTHWEKADVVKEATGTDWSEDWGEKEHEALIKLSVARCASTSYKTVDGFDMTLERAIALHDKLIASKPPHASPAEHVAQADDFTQREKTMSKWGGWEPEEWEHPHQHANFVGFRQYRHMLT